MLNNLKIIMAKLTKIIFGLIFVISAIVGFIFLLFRFHILDDCQDLGGVWDSEYNECRFDCRKWSKETGCILLSDEELEENSRCILYRCKMAKLELSKRQLRDKMNEQNIGIEQ